MGNVFDYLDWRGDLKFSEVGLCEVDSLILSMISYVNFEGIVPTREEGESVTLLEAMKKFTRMNRGKMKYLGKIISPDIINLTIRAAKSKRFSGIRLSHYINEICDESEKQFSAVTFRVTWDKYFVAFRGTDDTLVGWKENFNMSFMQPVPAQLSAKEYFEGVASDINGDFYLGGHSKGGNLAVYAATKSDESFKSRIIRVFNNDGPGFDEDFVNGEDYQKIRERVCTIVPQSSVVGMLLEHEENYVVIKSNAAGLLQHSGISWEVMGGSFFYLDNITDDSRLIDTKLKEYINAMTPKERENFVDTIYETLNSTNAKTLTELTSEKVKLVKAWGSLDQKTKNVLLKCVSILIKHNAITLKRK